MDLKNRLKKRFEENISLFFQNSGDDGVLEKFQNIYPAQELNSLSLEDYCLGKDSKPENFSWWLERGLVKPLGRYFPGTSQGHIIYKRKDGTFYLSKLFLDLKPEEALQYVLKITKMIAECVSLQDAQNFDEDEYIYSQLDLEPRSTMGPARKLRIFNAYHPSEAVCINSQPAIQHYLRELGMNDSEISSGIFGSAQQLMEQYQLLKVEMPSPTPWGFGCLLYDPIIGIKYSRPTIVKASEHIRKYVLSSVSNHRPCTVTPRKNEQGRKQNQQRNSRRN